MIEKILTKFFDFILASNSEYKTFWIFAFIILIIIYKFFNKPNVQNAIFQKFSVMLGNITENDINFHELFNKKNIYKNKIDSIKIGSKNKTYIFRTLLNTKLKIDIELTSKFVSNKDNYKLNRNEFCNLMQEHVFNLIKTYDAKFNEEIQKKYGVKKAEKLIELIMNSENGFKVNRIDRVSMILNFIDTPLRESKSYRNNHERIIAFLDLLRQNLRGAIWEAEVKFLKLNGEIDRIIKED